MGDIMMKRIITSPTKSQWTDTYFYALSLKMKETSVIVDSFILAHDAQTIESSFKHHPIPLLTKAFHRECS